MHKEHRTFCKYIAIFLAIATISIAGQAYYVYGIYKIIGGLM